MMPKFSVFFRIRSLRERVQKEYAQMSAMAEYSRQHYTNAAAQLSQQVDSLLITSFPELQPFLVTKLRWRAR